MESIDPEIIQSSHPMPVDEQQVDSANMALPDIAEPTLTPPSPASREVPLWGRLTAGALVIAGSLGLTSLGQEASASTPAKKEPTTTTVPSKQSTAKSGNSTQAVSASGGESLKVTSFSPELPLAKDPQTLVDQWDKNSNMALVNEDARYFDLILVNQDSDIGRFLNERLAATEHFREARDKKYSITIKSKVMSSDFSDPENSWIIAKGVLTEKAFALNRTTTDVTKIYVTTKAFSYDDGTGMKTYTITVPRYQEVIQPPKVKNR